MAAPTDDPEAMPTDVDDAPPPPSEPASNGEPVLAGEGPEPANQARRHADRGRENRMPSGSQGPPARGEVQRGTPDRDADAPS